MKLMAKVSAAFARIGAAICSAKEQAKKTKTEILNVMDVMNACREAFAAGVTIGKYKFVTTERVERGLIKECASRGVGLHSRACSPASAWIQGWLSRASPALGNAIPVSVSADM